MLRRSGMRPKNLGWDFLEIDRNNDELAEISPKMFKPMFNNLVKFSISVVGDKELSDQEHRLEHFRADLGQFNQGEQGRG
jgi:hypothetical protein